MKQDADIKELLQKAKESLRAAEVLWANGLYDFAASRAYYSMFYAAEAVLLTKNLSFSTHKAVIATFGSEFIKSGKLSASLHRNLRNAFRLRHTGDYGAVGAITADESQTLIKQAKEFINKIEEYLNTG
jgi:uncharacterized protein (UPF0332 family)